MAEDTHDTPKLDIDWLKTAAGALAAVTTAVLLSTLGAVGTLIGAALGSVGATVGSALYAQALAKSRQTVIKAQETALHKVGIAQAEVRRASRRHGDDAAVEAHLEHADERLGEARADLDEAVAEDLASTPTPGERFQALPWKRIGVVAAGTFLVVILAITAFERLAGQSVSSYTGGSDREQSSTFGGVTGDDGDGKGKPDKSDQQGDELDGPSDGASPDGDPSSQAPTDEPTEPTEPSVTPTPTPTVAPTPTPSPTAPLPTTPAPTP